MISPEPDKYTIWINRIESVIKVILVMLCIATGYILYNLLFTP